jgi:acyl-CoA dehydrogenase
MAARACRSAAAAAILEEIQAAGCNGASCHAQMYVMGTLLRHGSDTQKQALSSGIASGALRLQAFAVTEPGSGTDTAAITTTARRDGDRYIIRGRKIWTSRAEQSDLMILLARTSPIADGAKAHGGPLGLHRRHGMMRGRMA